ncbi:hypothetical protein PoB_001931200 [Plakobranchus ocellatus]|uniref:Uncharacterized protein n=1 Tax=Plakobranchus ocellatus TaxID=259542 RepID=A0AAV3ZBY3_9GAST|nr:hypothetical protein PoB_001931200 [Plakobranchus ocellatus]
MEIWTNFLAFCLQVGHPKGDQGRDLINIWARDLLGSSAEMFTGHSPKVLGRGFEPHPWRPGLSEGLKTEADTNQTPRPADVKKPGDLVQACAHLLKVYSMFAARIGAELRLGKRTPPRLGYISVSLGCDSVAYEPY